MTWEFWTEDGNKQWLWWNHHTEDSVWGAMDSFQPCQLQHRSLNELFSMWLPGAGTPSHPSFEQSEVQTQMYGLLVIWSFFIQDERGQRHERESRASPAAQVHQPHTAYTLYSRPQLGRRPKEMVVQKDPGTNPTEGRRPSTKSSSHCLISKQLCRVTCYLGSPIFCCPQNIHCIAPPSVFFYDVIVAGILWQNSSECGWGLSSCWLQVKSNLWGTEIGEPVHVQHFNKPFSSKVGWSVCCLIKKNSLK